MYIEISNILNASGYLACVILGYFISRSFFKVKRSCAVLQTELETISERLNQLYTFYYGLEDNFYDLERRCMGQPPIDLRSHDLLPLDFEEDIPKPKRGRPPKK